ncbi:hypothetical protein [Luminiphilus syltensis]|nr:hypothetical protein [Luminiphilus syltensis]
MSGVLLTVWSSFMNKMELWLTAPIMLATTQAQAAVDVTGFTVEGASRPYGLIALALLLVGIGLTRMRKAS